MSNTDTIDTKRCLDAPPPPPLPLMAGARCVTVSLLLLIPPSTPRFRRIPILSSTISASQFPLKPPKRKNHLRPKILKTLTKPYPTDPISPPTLPIPSIEIASPEIPSQNEFVRELPTGVETCSVAAGEIDKVEQLQVQETSGVAEEYSSLIGNIYSKDVFKYGLYLVGLFVFQTICTAWVLGTASSTGKDGDVDNLNSGVNGIDKRKPLLNGKVSSAGYFNESELEEKIAEIRAMARVARKSEVKLRGGTGGGDIVEEGSSSKDGIGIEDEIGARLAKLKKRLNSKREKLPGSFMNLLATFGEGEDGTSEDEVSSDEDNNKMLVFEKKLKFKRPLVDPRSKPKGFSGLQDPSDDNKKQSRLGGEVVKGTNGSNDDDGDDSWGKLEPENRKIQPNGKIDNSNSNEKASGRAEVRKEMDTANADMRFAKETHKGRSSVEVTKSRKPKDVRVQNSQTLTKENQGRSSRSGKPSVRSRTTGSKHRVTRDKPLISKVADKQSDSGTGLWWQKLPYILAILMRRGSGHEGSEGLFTLKSSSQAQDDGDFSYAVAFEDRIDANNFCYILESFFEDLGDFSADVVPMSTKELHAAVNSNFKKVIVVKKGQLQLYAGQPLADVEMALRSLVDPNQCASLPNTK
ncbi:wound-responsive family protein [Tripterygium wilfordii]|uniref:Wound-responsive family protein n=1 Tax=Tripterygium wilfordii TaxID=458696 RepID=A0A7J7CXA5_TRIWF|nr:uncharacterized protein LOC120013182 isoform X2 [Tripterygium wilfordii]KAF5738721.1 wound-responsive family protein [Tripterygium wilfordii]